MCQLLEQIESNDIMSLTLEASPKEALEKKKPDALVEALGKNTSITTVTLKTDFLACLRADVRSQVLQAIAKLPALQSVTLGNSLVLAPDLTSMVKSAKKLNNLTLDEICIQGEEALVEELRVALASNGTLKSFTLNKCMASNQSVDLAALENVKVGCGGKAAIDPAADVNAATAA
jgi:NAD(P)H-flavin reductase